MSGSSSPNLDNNNANILIDIEALQVIEQKLFQNLEVTGLTDDQRNEIITKINDISNMRLKLYLTLSGINRFYKNALSNTRDTLVQQTDTISMVESELNSARKRLTTLEEEKNNKIRLVEINDYYGQKYEEHTYLMKILIAIMVPILVLSLLLRKGILPSQIYFILVFTVAIIGGFFLSKVLSSVLTRDSMNYQAYNWAFDAASAPRKISSTNSDPWASISFPDTGTCVGNACCSTGLIYDETNNICVASNAESFVNYNAF